MSVAVFKKEIWWPFFWGVSLSVVNTTPSFSESGVPWIYLDPQIRNEWWSCSDSWCRW